MVDITNEIISSWAKKRSDDAGWVSRLYSDVILQNKDLIDAVERFTNFEEEIRLLFADHNLERTIDNAFIKANEALTKVKIPPKPSL